MMEESTPVKDILKNLEPFKLDTEESIGSYVVLRKGDVSIEFDAKDVRNSSEDTAVTLDFEVIVHNSVLKQDMIFDCSVQKANDYDDDDEEEQDDDVEEASEPQLLLEGVRVVNSDDNELDEEAYSPNFDELDEDLQQSFFDFLESHGVKDTLAGELLPLAEIKEQKEYLEWLANMKAFVAK